MRLRINEALMKRKDAGLPKIKSRDVIKQLWPEEADEKMHSLEARFSLMKNKDKEMVRMSELVKLADILGCTTDFLLGRTINNRDSSSESKR
jgi:hypothetical protein